MKRVDHAVPLGFALGVAAVAAGAWLEGVSLRLLWQPAALLVVCGGTLGALVIRRGLGGVVAAARACLGSCRGEDKDATAATITRLVWLARTARREGVRAFESQLATTGDPLVRRGLRLAADLAEPAEVRRALDLVLDDEDRRAACDVATLEAAGGFAPTFGILGAVLGLVHTLRSLADPSALGSGIATAFVATIYGVGVANMLLLPLAARLRERRLARLAERERLADALVALAAQGTPAAVLAAFNAHDDAGAPRAAAARI